MTFISTIMIVLSLISDCEVYYPHIILNSSIMFGDNVMILVEKRDWIMYINVHNVYREFGWNAINTVSVR
jgi:hypothetical protein